MAAFLMLFEVNDWMWVLCPLKQGYTNGMHADTVEKKTVLIVDDDEEIRDMYARRLGLSDIATLTAESGDMALAQAETHKPDLILLDIKMPGMDGFEMLKQLRAKSDWGAHVPVIFLTNVAPDTDATNAAIEETGPAYYIVKSQTDPSELVTKIREVLGS
jgi:CheY-like chemotaxis protein